MYRVFDDTTPVVEGLSIDEAFLDVRGMERIAGTPAEIAARLRREVRERVGLPITVGVARTKFLAKVASAVAKPDGLLVVPPDGELAFLHPLPVERLWGVGAVTAAKLHARGITTVGEVALLGEEVLVGMLGRATGRHLHALAAQPRPAAGRESAAGGARSARSARSAARRGRPRRSTPRSSRSSTASPAACARRGESAARSCCACASTTSRARRARTRSRARRRRRGRSSPPRAELLSASRSR